MLNAPAEAYDILKRMGMPILPEKDDLFFRPGVRRGLVRVLYFIMAKTSIGDLIACAHCRNAVTELEMLDQDFSALTRRGGGPNMPIGNALKAQMPADGCNLD